MYRFYNDLEQEFYQGAYQDGLSIQSDLEERMLLAQNLVTVARRYLDAEDPSIAQTLRLAWIWKTPRRHQKNIGQQSAHRRHRHPL